MNCKWNQNIPLNIFAFRPHAHSLGKRIIGKDTRVVGWPISPFLMPASITSLGTTTAIDKESANTGKVSRMFPMINFQCYRTPSPSFLATKFFFKNSNLKKSTELTYYQGKTVVKNKYYKGNFYESSTLLSHLRYHNVYSLLWVCLAT